MVKQTVDKNEQYVLYMRDVTQDKTFKAVNPHTGAYIKRGETPFTFNKNQLDSCYNYAVVVNRANMWLLFEIRTLTGKVVYKIPKM